MESKFLGSDTPAIMSKRRTPSEHIEDAERYLNAFTATVDAYSQNDIRPNQTDIGYWDTLLHAAEAHAALASLKLQRRDS